MVLVDPIQDTNHCTAKTSQSSAFLVFTQYWANGLLDFPKLISARSYETAIEEITAYWVPYLVYSDSHTTKDPSEVSESLLARRVFTGGDKNPESDFSHCSQEPQR